MKMTEYLDKKKVIEAIDLELKWFPNFKPVETLRELRARIDRGHFDAEIPADTDPDPILRTLPKYEGSTSNDVRTYNMRDSESRFAYLLDITDLLLGFKNTHDTKEPLNKERISWLMNSVKCLLEKNPPEPADTCPGCGIGAEIAQISRRLNNHGALLKDHETRMKHLECPPNKKYKCGVPKLAAALTPPNCGHYPDHCHPYFCKDCSFIEEAD